MVRALSHGPDRPRLCSAVKSRHAACRSQQRSIPEIIVDGLLRFGEGEPAGEGCERCYFTKSTWHSFLRYIGRAARVEEKYRDVYLIVADDGMVVTAGWRR